MKTTTGIMRMMRTHINSAYQYFQEVASLIREYEVGEWNKNQGMAMLDEINREAAALGMVHLVSPSIFLDVEILNEFKKAKHE